MTYMTGARLAGLSCAAALIAGAAGGEARAATLVTYVSASGAADPQFGCSVSHPCASFTDALAETSANGTIFVMGPYPLPLLGQSLTGVSIVGVGAVWAQGLTMQVPAGKSATIEGVRFLRFDQTNGLVLNGAGKVTIKGCSFTGFPDAGVLLAGPAGARAVLDDVTIKTNGVGLRVKGANGAANSAFVQKSLIDANTVSAVQVDGAANTVVISDSTLSGSGQLDLSLLNGGKAISYRSNVIRSGTPTQSLPEN